MVTCNEGGLEQLNDTRKEVEGSCGVLTQSLFLYNVWGCADLIIAATKTRIDVLECADLIIAATETRLMAWGIWIRSTSLFL